jgi:hypothetical protein
VTGISPAAFVVILVLVLAVPRNVRRDAFSVATVARAPANGILDDANVGPYRRQLGTAGRHVGGVKAIARGAISLTLAAAGVPAKTVTAGTEKAAVGVPSAPPAPGIVWKPNV